MCFWYGSNPVFFTSHSKKKLKMRGVMTITIHTFTHDTKWATHAVRVWTDRMKLSPTLIFKGKENVRIAAKEFWTFPPGCKYSCPKNAWMDKGAILEWAERILKPFIAIAPGNVTPILMLDFYWCHMMASVVNSIQNLTWKLSISLVNVPHFFSLLMLELTGHWGQRLIMIQRIGCLVQISISRLSLG